jgi:hypothetical protein
MSTPTFTATVTDSVTGQTGTKTATFTVTGNPKIATLVDNFSANDLPSLWSNSVGTFTWSTGEVGVKCDTSWDSSLVSGVSNYDLTTSSIYLKAAPYLASGSATDLYLSASAGNNLFFGQSGTNLVVYKTIGGTQTALFNLTFNATSMAWWKVSESGGTVSFATAPDSSGSPGTWTTQYSCADTVFTFGLTSLSVTFGAGDYNNDPTGTSYLYAVNAASVTPSPPPPPSAPSPPAGYTQTYTHDFTTGGQGDWVTQPGPSAAVAVSTTNGLGITVDGNGQWAELISSDAVITANCFVQAELYIPLDPSTGEVANWPAWWTTGTNWPVNGEIDIMEGQIGYASLQTHYGTLETNGTASINSTSEQAPFGTGGWITISMLRTGGQATAWYGSLEVGTVPMPATANHTLIFQNQGYNASYPNFHGPLDYPVTAYLKNVTVWSG